jgi:hypothetical protein
MRLFVEPWGIGIWIRTDNPASELIADLLSWERKSEEMRLSESMKDMAEKIRRTIGAEYAS